MHQSIRQLITYSKQYIDILLEALSFLQQDSSNEEILMAIQNGIDYLQSIGSSMQNSGMDSLSGFSDLASLVHNSSWLYNDVSKEHVKQQLTLLKQNLLVNDTVAIVFSKDRAMQLDGLLNSFRDNCKDYNDVDVFVLYLCSDAQIQQQYDLLSQDYPEVTFLYETSFKEQLVSTTMNFENVLFLVDDTIFIREFLVTDAKNLLLQIPTAIGISLRLGLNTTYCYPHQCTQQLPDYTEVSPDFLLFDWRMSQYDFGYPLEVSSSIYRAKEIVQYLDNLTFSNPNTLEDAMFSYRHTFGNTRPHLVCYNTSIAFSIPVNKVQSVNCNRSNEMFSYTAHHLFQLFHSNKRISVDHYRNFTPESCHQEVELVFHNILPII